MANSAEGLTASQLAAELTGIPDPSSGETQLIMPTVPAGYTVRIESSDNTAVISTNGTIIPPVVATTVNLVFEIIRISDESKASTITCTVNVPAKIINEQSLGLDGIGTSHGVLSPEFSTTTYDYTLDIDYTFEYLTLTFQAEVGEIWIDWPSGEWNQIYGEAGYYSITINQEELNMGENAISISVIEPNKLPAIYTIILYKNYYDDYY